mmetsp:Transcript_50631/g.120811  ORF Transcript_50631/g.120811 Transcript_50631/m.120811 type:complete len:373 (+) Transcript_50631:390-1508(+)
MSKGKVGLMSGKPSGPALLAFLSSSASISKGRVGLISGKSPALWEAAARPGASEFVTSTFVDAATEATEAAVEAAEVTEATEVMEVTEVTEVMAEVPGVAASAGGADTSVLSASRGCESSSGAALGFGSGSVVASERCFRRFLALVGVAAARTSTTSGAESSAAENDEVLRPLDNSFACLKETDLRISSRSSARRPSELWALGGSSTCRMPLELSSSSESGACQSNDKDGAVNLSLIFCRSRPWLELASIWSFLDSTLQRSRCLNSSATSSAPSEERFCSGKRTSSCCCTGSLRSEAFLRPSSSEASARLESSAQLPERWAWSRRAAAILPPRTSLELSSCSCRAFFSSHRRKGRCSAKASSLRSRPFSLAL